MDEEASSSLSGFTDIIQAYWPYSLIFNPFAALNEELYIWCGHFGLCGGGTVGLVSTGTLLSLQHGGIGCSSRVPVLRRLFSIHQLPCGLSAVTCHRGICMTRCRTRARYEASLTKSPRHPVKSETHLDKVTDKNFINLVCNFFVIDLWLKLLQEELPFPWNLSATRTEIGKNYFCCFLLAFKPTFVVT